MKKQNKREKKFNSELYKIYKGGSEGGWVSG